jgi:hypothetical protein
MGDRCDEAIFQERRWLDNFSEGESRDVHLLMDPTLRRTPDY